MHENRRYTLVNLGREYGFSDIMEFRVGTDCHVEIDGHTIFDITPDDDILADHVGIRKNGNYIRKWGDNLENVVGRELTREVTL